VLLLESAVRSGPHGPALVGPLDANDFHLPGKLRTQAPAVKGTCIADVADRLQPERFRSTRWFRRLKLRDLPRSGPMQETR
jgi:hypothetical protein